MKRCLVLLLAAALIAGLVGCATQPVTVAPDIQQGSAILPGSEPDIGEQEPNGEFPPAGEEPPAPIKQEQPKPQTPAEEQKPADTGKEEQPQTPPTPQEPENTTPTPNNAAAPTGEYRAVWISYLELSGILTGKTAAQFRSGIGKMFDNAVAARLNTVIVHARPFGDALYASDYFPTSYLITGTEGASLSFDPLKIMVEEAHSRGLSIEAWLNPYRVRASGSRTLAASNPAKQWLDAGSNAVYTTSNGGIFYNPGSQKAIDLIVSGVKEIVQNYDVDAIHFDDYFYAATDASIDAALYSAYQSGGGGKSLAAWRRNNVNEMVRQVYSAIKSADPSVRFGISPQGNTNINYNTLYADVATWLGNSGYVDYICPQVYYGFHNAACPYETVVKEFNSMIKVSGIDLYVGLAAYKIGTEDTYAGASGKTEWQNNSDMLCRMVSTARTAGKYAGFSLYSYASLWNPASAVSSRVTAEQSALQAIL